MMECWLERAARPSPLDPVPNTLGLGEATKWDPLTDAGKGAKVNYFTESHGIDLIANHGFDSVYLKHRQVPEAQ
jgi:hypothetical protein